MITQVRRWLPERAIVVVADTTYAVWERLSVAWYGCSTRSVDLASGTAVWYHGGLPVVPRRWAATYGGSSNRKPCSVPI
jgi:hypothetical protein